MEEGIEIGLQEETKSGYDSEVPITKTRKKQISGSYEKPKRGKKLKQSVEKSPKKKKITPRKGNNGVEPCCTEDEEIGGVIIKNEFNKIEVKYPVKFENSNAVVLVNDDDIADYENDENDDNYENISYMVEENQKTDESLMMEVYYDDLVEELDVCQNRITPKKEDQELVNNFLSKECCKRRCNTKFQSDELLLYRLELLSIDYNEQGVNQLDLVLLGLIHSLCRISDEISHSRRIKKVKRRRIKMMFAFRGVSVCRAMFMFAHGIKIERLKRLLKRYKEQGITPKPHGNYKRIPPNAISIEQVQNVVEFLRDYAKGNGAIVPGRTSYLNQDIKLLPPSETKLQVFQKYKEFCDERNLTCISLRPENGAGSHSQKNRSSKYTDDSDN